MSSKPTLRSTIQAEGFHINVKREVLFEDTSGKVRTVQRLDFFKPEYVDFLMRRYLSPHLYYNIKKLEMYEIHNLIYHYYREWMDEHSDASFIKMQSVCERRYESLGAGYLASYRLMLGNSGSVVDTVVTPGLISCDKLCKPCDSGLYCATCGACECVGCSCPDDDGTDGNDDSVPVRNQSGQWVTPCSTCHGYDCICDNDDVGVNAGIDRTPSESNTEGIVCKYCKAHVRLCHHTRQEILAFNRLEDAMLKRLGMIGND